jgi:hypothetical protein
MKNTIFAKRKDDELATERQRMQNRNGLYLVEFDAKFLIADAETL